MGLLETRAAFVGETKATLQLLRALVDGDARHSKLRCGLSLAEAIDEKHDRERLFGFVERRERLERSAACLGIDTGRGPNRIDFVDRHCRSHVPSSPEEIETRAIGGATKPTIRRLRIAQAFTTAEECRQEILQGILRVGRIAQEKSAASLEQRAITVEEIAHLFIGEAAGRGQCLSASSVGLPSIRSAVDARIDTRVGDTRVLHDGARPSVGDGCSRRE
jgi:hypothetical protein